LSRFARNIAPYVMGEVEKSTQAEANGDYRASFTHLENAHVLGQASTYWHVKVHWLMLRWGLRRRDAREVFGQVIRILGAAVLTAVKGVPIGNTGGSNVSPVKPMPITAAHAEIIARARADT